MTSSGPSGPEEAEKVVIIGCNKKEHQATVEIIRSVCHDEGWETDWVSCPSYQLPSKLHLPNYLGGEWRVLVLHELRSGHRRKVISAADDAGIPAAHLENYSPASVRKALRELDRPVEEPPVGHRVAVKIIQKLMRMNRWGGAHSFLWWTDLPAGGFDAAEEQPFVHDVAEILIREGLLVTKRKQGKRKVALNGDRRGEIHSIADGRIKSSDLRKELGPDKIGY